MTGDCNVYYRIPTHSHFGPQILWRTQLDNIITILVGAVLSRAVVSASDFVQVIIASLVIVLLHRLFGWCIAHSKAFGRFVEGDKIILFQNGKFVKVKYGKGTAMRKRRYRLCPGQLMVYA